MKKRLPKIMCLLLALAMLLAGCGSKTGETAAKPEEKDSLIVVISTDPANMSANESATQYHYQVTRQMYETLFVYDENYNIQPWLCESYEYLDDVTLLLKIRQGVKFHNGDELKASDVYFTFERAVNSERKEGAGTQLASLDIGQCEAVDDYTLKLVLKQPNPTFINLLENPSVGIMSERAYQEANGDYLNGAAVGTGPYKYVAYYPGDRIEMEAFDEYWNDAPYFKKLTMRIVSDSTSRSIEAETKSADIVYDIAPNDIEKINATDGVSVISDLGTNTSMLNFNVTKAPTDNAKVREAIFYALDAETAVKLAYGDYGSFASGFVCPGVLGYDESLREKYWPKRDLERAKQCLKEAGYENGVEVEIAVNTNDKSRSVMAEAFQAQLAEAGITLKINAMESSAFNTYLAAGEQNLCIYGYSATDFEADRCLLQHLPSHVNYSICHFDNEEFRNLVSKSAVTLDRNEREQLYKDAIELIMENYVMLPLWHKSVNAAVNDSLEGFSISRSYEHHYLQYVKQK